MTQAFKVRDLVDVEPFKPHKHSSTEQKGTGGQARAIKSELVAASALQRMQFSPVRFVVPGFIAEGCTLLAGAPKLGKSWLLLEAANATATGGTCLGSVRSTKPGDVLYLALQDNLRRLKSRMDRLVGVSSPWPERLTFATRWPRSHEGGLDRIRDWANAAEEPRLAVIDVVTAFRPPVPRRENAYTADYQAVKVLTELAAELGIAIVGVLHTRKSRDQVDPFDRVSGTLGLSGAADSVLVLDRDGQGVTLYGRGRDIPEIEAAVTFDKETCRWSITGSATEVRLSDERKVIVDALLITTAPMSPAEIAGATRMPRNSVKQLLFKMLTAGHVTKLDRGRYIHPDRTDLKAF